MRTQFIRNKRFYLFIATFLFIRLIHAGIVTRLHVFSDGSVLYSADLNSEFNNIINTVNNLDNDNISSTANISPSKLSASLAGDGLASTVGVLSVNTDGVGIETNSDALRLRDGGVTLAKLATLTGLSVIGNVANSTAAPIAITAGNDGEVLRRAGTDLVFGVVATAGIANGAITQAKRAALGQQVSSSSGSFSTSSSTITDVTNLSVSITVTGRPVEIMMVADGSSGTTLDGNEGYVQVSRTSNDREDAVIAFDRGGTIVGKYQIGELGTTSVNTIGRVTIPCSAFHHVEIPAAGTYTYKVRAFRSSSASSVSVNQCKLIVFEL